MADKNVNESDNEDQFDDEPPEPTLGLIDAVRNKDYVAAGEYFQGMINSKIADALEGERIALAGEMFGDERGTEHDDDITDQDLQNAEVDDDDDDDDE